MFRYLLVFLGLSEEDSEDLLIEFKDDKKF